MKDWKVWFYSNICLLKYYSKKYALFLCFCRVRFWCHFFNQTYRWNGTVPIFEENMKKSDLSLKVFKSLNFYNFRKLNLYCLRYRTTLRSNFWFRESWNFRISTAHAYKYKTKLHTKMKRRENRNDIFVC